MRSMAAALALAMALTGCVRGSGTRCERVCRAESACSDKLDLGDYDVSGCIEACADLERNGTTQRLVDEHVRCVNTAPTCGAVLDCP